LSTVHKKRIDKTLQNNLWSSL